jgi:hypothetical protein
VQTALKACHPLERLTRIESPRVGWLKYAEVRPARALSGVTRKYPPGTD